MMEAYELAGQRASEGSTRVLEPGDRVLVRNLSERGDPGKLHSHCWEERIHVVVSRRGGNSPVYEVKPEVGPGGTRALHRNLLRPCNHLPVDIPSGVTQQSRQRTRHKTRTKPTVSAPVEEVSGDESSEDEWPAEPNRPQGLDAVHQGKPCNEESVVEEVTPASSSEREDPLLHHGPDASTQDVGGQEDVVEHEPRQQRQRPPPTILTYDTLGNPVYESRSVVHAVSRHDLAPMSGDQPRQYPVSAWITSAPTPQQSRQQFAVPVVAPVQHPMIFGSRGLYPSTLGYQTNTGYPGLHPMNLCQAMYSFC